MSADDAVIYAFAFAVAAIGFGFGCVLVAYARVLIKGGESVFGEIVPELPQPEAGK